jgi:nucleoside-diphosphate kinase
LCYTLLMLASGTLKGSAHGTLFLGGEGQVERTLFIIKPDSVRRNLVGQILSIIEDSGLSVIGMKMLKLTAEKAGEFYHVHRGKPFYENLVAYISSGRCVVAAVEGTDAIRRVRQICGATDPSAAEHGTIRARFGLSVTMNSVHASDSAVSAVEEIEFFFPGLT